MGRGRGKGGNWGQRKDNNFRVDRPRGEGSTVGGIGSIGAKAGSIGDGAQGQVSGVQGTKGDAPSGEQPR